MRKLNIAATPAAATAFRCERPIVDFDRADLTEVSAVVLTAAEAAQGLKKLDETGFGIPVAVVTEGEKLPDALVGRADTVITRNPNDRDV